MRRLAGGESRRDERGAHQRDGGAPRRRAQNTAMATSLRTTVCVRRRVDAEYELRWQRFSLRVSIDVERDDRRSSANARHVFFWRKKKEWGKMRVHTVG